jgi:hypothetical protein
LVLPSQLSQERHIVKATPSFHVFLIQMKVWKEVEAGLDVLLSDAQACMKGPELQDVCSTLQTFCAAGFNSSNKPRDTTEVLDCLQCFVKAMQLLAKLLSARKRARDWKQQEYSSRVCTVLAAATAVLQHPSLYVTASAGGKMCVRMLGDTDLMPLVAAAQQEVAQLLLAHTHSSSSSSNSSSLTTSTSTSIRVLCCCFHLLSSCCCGGMRPPNCGYCTLTVRSTSKPPQQQQQRATGHTSSRQWSLRQQCCRLQDTAALLSSFWS